MATDDNIKQEKNENNIIPPEIIINDEFVKDGTTKKNLENDKEIQRFDELNKHLEELTETQEEILEYIGSLYFKYSEQASQDDSIIEGERQESYQEEQTERDESMLEMFQELSDYIIGGELVQELKGDSEEIQELDLGEDEAAAAGGKSFLQTLGEGLKYWGDNAGKILLGALTFAGTMLILAASVVLITIIISQFSQSASIEQLLTFGAVLILMAGFTLLYGKIMENVNLGSLVKGSLALALMGIGVLSFATTFLIIGQIDVNWVNIILLFGMILLTGLITVLASSLLSSIATGSLALMLMGIGLLTFSLTMLIISQVDLSFPQVLTFVLGLTLLLGVTALAGVLSPFIMVGAAALLIMGIGLLIAILPLVLINQTNINMDTVTVFMESLLYIAGRMALIGLLSPFIILGSAALLALSIGLLPSIGIVALINNMDVDKSKAEQFFESIWYMVGQLSLLALATPAIVWGSAAVSLLGLSLYPITGVMLIMNEVETSKDKMLEMIENIRLLAEEVGGLSDIAWDVAKGSLGLIPLGAALSPIASAIDTFSTVEITTEKMMQMADLIRMVAADYIAPLSDIKRDVKKGSKGLAPLAEVLEPIANAFETISEMEQDDMLGKLESFFAGVGESVVFISAMVDEYADEIKNVKKQKKEFSKISDVFESLTEIGASIEELGDTGSGITSFVDAMSELISLSSSLLTTSTSLVILGNAMSTIQQSSIFEGGTGITELISDLKSLINLQPDLSLIGESLNIMRDSLKEKIDFNSIIGVDRFKHELESLSATIPNIDAKFGFGTEELDSIDEHIQELIKEHKISNNYIEAIIMLMVQQMGLDNAEDLFENIGIDMGKDEFGEETQDQEFFDTLTESTQFTVENTATETTGAE